VEFAVGCDEFLLSLPQQRLELRHLGLVEACWAASSLRTPR
jgi:hypothetical protein